MMTTNNTLEAMDSIGGSCALADVVIVDSEGGLLHYQAPVDQAAAAACHGRAPLAVYAPTTTNHQRPSQHNSSRGGSMQHSAAGGGLAPGGCGLAEALFIAVLRCALLAACVIQGFAPDSQQCCIWCGADTNVPALDSPCCC